MRPRLGILMAVVMTVPAMAFVPMDDVVIISRDSGASRRVVSEGSVRLARYVDMSNSRGTRPEYFSAYEQTYSNSDSHQKVIFAAAGDVHRGVVSIPPKEFYTGH